MAFSLDPTDWPAVVERIRANDQEAMEYLYKALCKFTRFHIWQQIGNGTDEGDGTDDCLHGVFMVTVEAIRNGEIRDPQRLMGYVQGVSRFKVANIIKRRVARRRRICVIAEAVQVPAPKQEREDEDGKQVIVQRALAKLSEKDRRILIAFYIEERTWQEICSEMNLTPTQYRLRKSRALARFGKFGRAELRARSKKVIAINDRRRAPMETGELRRLAA